jgi:hypothetical protein
MANHKNSERETDSQHDESVFIFGMFRVIEADGVLVEKDCPGFFECNAMLSFVFPVLALIPFEVNVIHMYNVRNI